MREYLKDVLEERQPAVIDRCYDCLSSAYSRILKNARYLDMKCIEGTLKGRDDMSWEDFVYSVDYVHDSLEKIEERQKYIEKHIEEDAKTRLISDIVASPEKWLKEAGYEDMAKDIDVLVGIDKRNIDVPVAIIVTNFVDKYIDGQVIVWPYKVDSNDDLREDLFYLILRNFTEVSNSDSIAKMRMGREMCRNLKDKAASSDLVAPAFKSICYVEETLQTGIRYNMAMNITEDLRRNLNKLERSVKQANKIKIKKEKTQAEIIEEQHQVFFRRLHRLTDNERSIKNIEFIRNTANAYETIEEPTFEILHDLTGVEYNIMFHLINEKRPLNDSEKDLYQSLTGSEFI